MHGSQQTVCRMTGSLIHEEQEGFREGRGCLNQIFIVKQISEKARSKNISVCGFYRFRGVQ